MSQDAFRIVCQMDKKNIDNQIALQCAPLIAGLKPSNLLSISKFGLRRVWEIIKGTGISYTVLLVSGQRVTVLLYKKEELENYLKQSDVKSMFNALGYQEIDLKEILPIFQSRYQKYMEENKNFPHEMGLLLGYPVEDVDGFIRHEGKNSLYMGYWKVYGNLQEKLQLFLKFEIAKENLIQLISDGVSMREIIGNKEILLRVAA